MNSLGSFRVVDSSIQRYLGENVISDAWGLLVWDAANRTVFGWLARTSEGARQSAVEG